MDENTLPLKRYREHSRRCRHRIDADGTPIEMKLTFAEWWQIWSDSGHWSDRGTRRGQYCMSRNNDLGHYEVGNVFIQLRTENSQEPQLRALIGRISRNVQSDPVIKNRARTKNKEIANRPEILAISRITLNDPVNREKSRIGHCKPCTVDGITIYESKQAMKKALGQGVAGTRSPHFRFIS